MTDNILVTGGAGFIGSHTCKYLHRSGYQPIVYDNLSTGNRRSVRWGALVEGDIGDSAVLQAAIERYRPIAVIHFAASAYVGESAADPAKYYRNNVAGTLSLLEACRRAGVSRIIFSSSCATYGAVKEQPIAESAPQSPVNVYGWTKLIGERMLTDFAGAYGLQYAVLRYFNACGADPEGELGEWHDPETHLVPRALMAASGQIDRLEVFGDDYPTADGTCVRDYIHVCDLARAHVMAAEHLRGGGGNLHLNLGTGRGTTIRQVLASIHKVTGREVPIVIRPRRPGDPPALIADASLAKTVLGFTPRYSDMDSIVKTASRFFGLDLAS